VARKLTVPHMVLLVNKVPTTFDLEEVKATVEETYNCKVAAVLPHSDEMMALASAGVFVLHYPDHQVTSELRRLAASLSRSKF
jgi:septum site-determining protein MinD